MNPMYSMKMSMGDVASGRPAPQLANKELSDEDWSFIGNLFNGSESLYDVWNLLGLSPPGEGTTGWTGEGDTPGLPGNPSVTPGSPGDPGSAPPGSGSSGLPSWLSQIARMFGLGGNSGGGGGGGNGSNMGIMNLLSLLGTGAGAGLNYINTREATDAMLGANREATDFLRGQMGAGDERFKPYTDIGREAVWNINAMGPRALVDRYKPLGSGRGMTTLGKVAQGKAL